MGERELADLLCLSSWYLVFVVWVFLMMPRVCMQFVIVVFPDHTHLLFLMGGEEADCYTLIVFLIYCDPLCQGQHCFKLAHTLI